MCIQNNHKKNISLNHLKKFKEKKIKSKLNKKQLIDLWGTLL